MSKTQADKGQVFDLELSGTEDLAELDRIIEARHGSSAVQVSAEDMTDEDWGGGGGRRRWPVRAS